MPVLRIPFRSLLIAGILMFRLLPVAAQDDGNQESLTLEAALDLAAEHNTQLILARLDVNAAEGALRQSGAYPNPALSLTHEPLSSGGDSYSESYLNLSQTIEWPSLRRARRFAARASLDARESDLRFARLSIERDVAAAYNDAWAASQRMALLDDLSERFAQAESASLRQLDDGELSAFDVERLQVERIRYEAERAIASEALRAARLDLSVLIYPPDVDRVAVPSTSPALPSADVVTYDDGMSILSDRPDLAAARSERDAAGFQRDAARAARFSQFAVTAGVKRQSDGFSGVLLGLAVPIPVFDRNRGAIEASEAQFNAASLQSDALNALAGRLLLAARQTLKARQERFDHLSHSDRTDKLLHAAQLGYEEGELSLLALIDAVNAHRESNLLLIDARADLVRAWLDFLMMTGQSPRGFVSH
jgi:cobalt-zinc-cadmium efflux system outer membrane protein